MLSLRYLISVCLLCSLSGPLLADVPRPVVQVNSAGDACIAAPDVMRREHPALLSHQRDRALRQGIRGEKVSLNGCIECHASPKNGSVLGSSENFCQSCHQYVGIQLDCFECHQPAPTKKGVTAKEKP